MRPLAEESRPVEGVGEGATGAGRLLEAVAVALEGAATFEGAVDMV